MRFRDSRKFFHFVFDSFDFVIHFGAMGCIGMLLWFRRRIICLGRFRNGSRFTLVSRVVLRILKRCVLVSFPNPMVSILVLWSLRTDASVRCTSLCDSAEPPSLQWRWWQSNCVASRAKDRHCQPESKYSSTPSISPRLSSVSSLILESQIEPRR